MKTLKELYFDTFDIAFEWMLSDGGDGWATVTSQFKSIEELRNLFDEWNALRGHKLIVQNETSDRITYSFAGFGQDSISITTKIELENGGTYQFII
jgi:hypothetical protein